MYQIPTIPSVKAVICAQVRPVAQNFVSRLQGLTSPSLSRSHRAGLQGVSRQPPITYAIFGEKERSWGLLSGRVWAVVPSLAAIGLWDTGQQ